MRVLDSHSLAADWQFQGWVASIASRLPHYTALLYFLASCMFLVGFLLFTEWYDKRAVRKL